MFVQLQITGAVEVVVVQVRLADGGSVSTADVQRPLTHHSKECCRPSSEG